MCGACGEEEEETAEHLILYCKGLHPVVAEEAINITNTLGLRDSEGKVDMGKVEITKKKLSDWWHRSREG